jgi:urease accessory protein
MPNQALANADVDSATPAQVTLRFACADIGPTWLAQQRAAYPFHVGRCLSICGDPARMATAYLQCCSGGLFEHDDLRLNIETGENAMAQVCTSAATIVHTMRGAQAKQTVTLVAKRDSHLEYLPESVILFPAARLLSSIRLELGQGATALLSEVMLAHDPQGLSRCFDQFQSILSVHARDGPALVRDRWIMHGDRFAQRLAGITGPHRAQATMLILRQGGGTASLVDCVRAVFPEHPSLYIGASRLPNDCGAIVRALSTDEPLLRATLRAVRDAARTVLLEKGTVAHKQEPAASRSTG